MSVPPYGYTGGAMYYGQGHPPPPPSSPPPPGAPAQSFAGYVGHNPHNTHVVPDLPWGMGAVPVPHPQGPSPAEGDYRYPGDGHAAPYNIFVPPSPAPTGRRADGDARYGISYVVTDAPSMPLGAVGMDTDALVDGQDEFNAHGAHQGGSSSSDVAATSAFDAQAAAPGFLTDMAMPSSVASVYVSHPTPSPPSQQPLTPTAPPAALFHDDYVIPDGAPKLMVPDGLPLSDIVLLDLVASTVVQGGPAVEEELVLRETPSRFNVDGNEAFSFLHASLSDARMRYYRWRLYSLLQGDSLTQWRTEPFQIERGPQAHVWLPPPPIRVGPDSLHDLWHVKASPHASDGKSAATTATSTSIPPSALWLARVCAEERVVFVTLTDDEEAEWRALLDPTRVPMPVDEDTTTTSVSTEASVASTTGPSTRSLRKRQRLVDIGLDDKSSSGGGAVPAPSSSPSASHQAHLFHADVIAERMAFVLDHMRAVYHALSILLDAMTRIAERAAHGAKGATNTRAFHDCQLCLWYLFILHDIIHNAGRTAPIDEAELAARYAHSQPSPSGTDDHALSCIADGVRAGTLGTAASTSPSTASSGTSAPRKRTVRHLHPKGAPLVVSALEMILPTALEVCAVVVVACAAGAGTEAADGKAELALRVSPSAPPSSVWLPSEASALVDSAPHDPTAPPPPATRASWWALETTTPINTATLTEGKATTTTELEAAAASVRADRVRAAGVLLLSWMQTLFPTWFGYRKGQHRAAAGTPPSAVSLLERPTPGAIRRFPASRRPDAHEGQLPPTGTADQQTGGGRSTPGPSDDAVPTGALRVRLRTVLGDKFAFLFSPEAVQALADACCASRSAEGSS